MSLLRIERVLLVVLLAASMVSSVALDAAAQGRITRRQLELPDANIVLESPNGSPEWEVEPEDYYWSYWLGATEDEGSLGVWVPKKHVSSLSAEAWADDFALQISQKVIARVARGIDNSDARMVRRSASMPGSVSFRYMTEYKRRRGDYGSLIVYVGYAQTVYAISQLSEDRTDPPTLVNLLRSARLIDSSRPSGAGSGETSSTSQPPVGRTRGTELQPQIPADLGDGTTEDPPFSDADAESAAKSSMQLTTWAFGVGGSVLAAGLLLFGVAWFVNTLNGGPSVNSGMFVLLGAVLMAGFWTQSALRDNWRVENVEGKTHVLVASAVAAVIVGIAGAQLWRRHSTERSNFLAELEMKRNRATFRMTAPDFSRNAMSAAIQPPAANSPASPAPATPPNTGFRFAPPSNSASATPPNQPPSSGNPPPRIWG